MFDIGGGELLLIVLAILLLFGPKKIPELAQMFGKGLAQFRKAQTEFQRNINAVSDEIQQEAHAVQQSIEQSPPQQTERLAADQSHTEQSHVAAVPTTNPAPDVTQPTDTVHNGVSSATSAVQSSAPPIVVRPAPTSVAR